MTNPWFKFYGSDYLSDPKMLGLDAVERSCWLTLLCYACAANEKGLVKYVDTDILLIQSGVKRGSSDFETHQCIIQRFETLGMITHDNGVITIRNWTKRQEVSLTNYERVKRYRTKKRACNEMITLDKKREEEKREDKNIGMFDLPVWINQEAWNLWVSYRSEIRKKMTDRTIKFQLTFLEAHKSDHIKIIETSIMNGWTGLFPLKNRNGFAGSPQLNDRARAYEKHVQADTEEREAKENEKNNDALRKIREQIRAVTAQKVIS